MHTPDKSNPAPKLPLFHVSRRSFLRSCALTAAATGLPSWFVERNALFAAENPAAKPRLANDRPGIALIGCGGMGRYDLTLASQFGDVVALCDVDQTHLDEAITQFTADGKKPVGYTDFRKLLERPDVHAIVNATPDHWHSLVNIAAVRAGKDVYGEKPLTLTIDEGRQVIDAVRKAGAVFQTGTQQRSMKYFRLAAELVRNGRIGKLKRIEIFLPAGLRDGPFQSQPVPATLNWDVWQGQAAAYDYLPQRCHGNFRFWHDYSGGTMTDWGAHHIDIARWALDQVAPRRVHGIVLEDPIPGGYTTIPEYRVNFDFDNSVEVCMQSSRADTIYGANVFPNGQSNGLRFEGTDGWIWASRNGNKASDPALLTTPLPETATRLYKSDDHFGNFFDCTRTRALPIADVETAHRSVSICHLGVISLRTGLKLEWDGKAERFTGDGAREANKYLKRKMRKPYDYSYVA
jgi:predicted dehydrogenase